MPAAPPRAVQLFGLIALDGTAAPAPGSHVGVMMYREMGALVGAAPYVPPLPDAAGVGAYRAVVEQAFARGTVLPAPFGTVFRTRDALSRWLELHYFTLLDAMSFVDARAMARVTLSADEEASPPSASGRGVTAEAAFAAHAAEMLRTFRARAVATLPPREDAPTSLRASFLVERERWSDFGELSTEERARATGVKVSVSGPWPPYDFVRMQFGA